MTTRNHDHHRVTGHRLAADRASSPRWANDRELTVLAMAIDEQGLGAYPELVRDFAAAGRVHAPVAAAVLADPHEPAVARERAFAVVAGALSRSFTAPNGASSRAVA
jgi:hypothetical protein